MYAAIWPVYCCCVSCYAAQTLEMVVRSEEINCRSHAMPTDDSMECRRYTVVAEMHQEHLHLHECARVCRCRSRPDSCTARHALLAESSVDLLQCHTSHFHCPATWARRRFLCFLVTPVCGFFGFFVYCTCHLALLRHYTPAVIVGWTALTSCNTYDR